MRFNMNNAPPIATGIIIKIIVVESIGNPNSGAAGSLSSVSTSPIGMLSITAVFDNDVELNPFPETIAEIVTCSFSLAITFNDAIPFEFVTSSNCTIFPPSTSHSTSNPFNEVVISGIVTYNWASILSFQFIVPKRFNDNTGVISTTLTSYFDNVKSSESNASSILPSLNVLHMICKDHKPLQASQC